MRRTVFIQILTSVLHFDVLSANGVLKITTKHGILYLVSVWWYPKWYIRIQFKIYCREAFNGSWKEVWAKLNEGSKEIPSVDDSS